MNRLLGLLLVIILFVIGLELFFFLIIKPEIKTANNTIFYPTKTMPNTKTDWEPWVPSEIRVYEDKTYGMISSALVKINKITTNTLVAELKNKDQINFQYDQSLDFFDRKEASNVFIGQKQNLTEFTIEVGKTYLVEWLEKSKENNKLWRISRLVL